MTPWTVKDLQKYSRIFLGAGCLLSLPLAIHHGDQLFRSYLLAYLTWVGIPIGGLGILLLYLLVGGEWGRSSHRILKTLARTIPWTALLFVPILIGLGRIYPWMHITNWTGVSAAHKRLYFRPPFFIARTAIYFALWSWLALRFEKRTAALGLVIYVFTVSFASFDWMMSLEPQWGSTIYGGMIMVGDVLSGFAFTVALMCGLREQVTPYVPDGETAVDLGNLLLAFVMLWTYMALSQYLIIWSANLPEEIGWYLARQRGGWQGVALLLIGLQFVLPFFLLLARKNKQRLASLGKVALLLVTVRLIDVFWLVVPDFHPAHFSFHFLDVTVMAALGGIWLDMFFRQLEKVPNHV